MPRLLLAALLAGLISAGCYLIGAAIPWRLAAVSEMTWANAWGMVGMVIGLIAARAFMNADPRKRSGQTADQNGR